MIKRPKDWVIGRSGDRVNRNRLLISSSDDRPGKTFPIESCSPDHPITRSPDWPIRATCVLLALTLLGASTPALDDFVRQFESSYHSVKTIRADFTQTYVTEGRTQSESGVVYFARGGLMRWDYQRPQPKLFFSDGKMLELYVPEEKQLTRTALKASDDIRVPFRLLLSRLDLRRVFSRIEFAPDALQHTPADRVLRGYPKKAFQEDYRQVLMVVSPQFDIRRLLVTLPDQSTMEFDFDHIERDVPLGRSLFQFTPPPGTEVIDQH
jgi:outer membrane lipoprotein carrier protein